MHEEYTGQTANYKAIVRWLGNQRKKGHAIPTPHITEVLTNRDHYGENALSKAVFQRDIVYIEGLVKLYTNPRIISETQLLEIAQWKNPKNDHTLLHKAYCHTQHTMGMVKALSPIYKRLPRPIVETILSTPDQNGYILLKKLVIREWFNSLYINEAVPAAVQTPVNAAPALAQAPVEVMTPPTPETPHTPPIPTFKAVAPMDTAPAAPEIHQILLPAPAAKQPDQVEAFFQKHFSHVLPPAPPQKSLAVKQGLPVVASVTTEKGGIAIHHSHKTIRHSPPHAVDTQTLRVARQDPAYDPEFLKKWQERQKWYARQERFEREAKTMDSGRPAAPTSDQTERRVARSQQYQDSLRPHAHASNQASGRGSNGRY